MAAGMLVVSSGNRATKSGSSTGEIIPTLVLRSGIARMAFGVASEPVPAVAGISSDARRRRGFSLSISALSAGEAG